MTHPQRACSYRKLSHYGAVIVTTLSLGLRARHAFAQHPAGLRHVSRARPRTCAQRRAGESSTSTKSLTIDLTLSFREVSSVHMAPDGQHVAFMVTQADRVTDQTLTSICVVATNGASSARTLLTASDITDLRWLPDSRHLTYLAKEGRLRQVWSITMRGGVRHALTRHSTGLPAGAESPLRGAQVEYELSPSGRYLAFFAYDTVAATRILRAGYRTGWVYGGSVATAHTWQDVSQPIQLWIIDLTTGHETRVWESPAAAPAGQFLRKIVWSPEGGRLALLYEPESAPHEGYSRYAAVLDVQSRQFRTVVGRGVVGSIVWRSDGQALEIDGLVPPVVNRTGDTRRPDTTATWDNYEVELGDTSMRRQTPPATPETVVADSLRARGIATSHCSLDRRRLRAACIAETNTMPPDIIVIPLRDGVPVDGPRRVTLLNPELRGIPLGEVRSIPLSIAVGRVDTLGVMLPAHFIQGQRYPLLLMAYNLYVTNHFALDAEGYHSWPAQVFAGHGYVVAFVPFRIGTWPAGDYGTARAVHTDQQVAAVRHVVDTLVALGIADSTHLGLLGWSYASEITDYVITHYPGWFAAAGSNEGGGLSLTTYWLSTDRWRKQIRFLMGPDPTGESLARWQVLSPTFAVRNCRTPVLMEYASDHTLALEFYNALRDVGAPAELVFYGNETHNFSRPATRYASMVRNYDWFNFWLLNEEDPAPAKKAQYVRWRALRDMGDQHVRGK